MPPMNQLERQILARVVDFPDVAVLLLFGSRARGDARPDSDLDVAVLTSGRKDDENASPVRHQLQKTLAVALSDLAPEGRVDVVFLDETPDTLRQRVMEHGRMVLCREPEAWQALRVATMKEYGDREWARRLYRRALRERLVEGRPSGRSARARQPLERARRLSRQT
jgi:predicted nucleotidyltransferase